MTLKINDGGIDRDMTASEFSEYRQTVKSLETQITAREARAVALVSARAKLAALGLTTEEIAALVG